MKNPNNENEELHIFEMNPYIIFIRNPIKMKNINVSAKNSNTIFLKKLKNPMRYMMKSE